MKENNQVFSVPNKKICVYESDLCSSENKACKKIQACSVFKPMTSAIPMRCGFFKSQAKKTKKEERVVNESKDSQPGKWKLSNYDWFKYHLY